MSTSLLCPLGDVSRIISYHPGKDISSEDDKILSIICLLEKCGASVLQQLLANHSLVGVKPWHTHAAHEWFRWGRGGGHPGDD